MVLLNDPQIRASYQSAVNTLYDLSQTSQKSYTSAVDTVQEYTPPQVQEGYNNVVDALNEYTPQLQEGYSNVVDTFHDLSDSIQSGLDAIYHEFTDTDADPDKQQMPSIVPEGPCSLRAIDLSTNHLQVIYNTRGKLDFVPTVIDKKPIFLRFRLQAKAGASSVGARDITAYRIVAHIQDQEIWNTGKRPVSTLPSQILWDAKRPTVGSLVEWKVIVWDAQGVECEATESSYFAMGPSEWTAPWKSHPGDVQQFEHDIMQMSDGQHQQGCPYWTRRRPLPLFRTKFMVREPVQSALLVVSGLGLYHASIQGQPLSQSILEPAMTDYTQRIFYRAFPIALDQFVKNQLVLGMTMGSGWWDPRPLTGGMIPLQFLPRGAATVTAILYVTYKDGTIEAMPAQDWQTTKGFVRDAELYTGDTIDIGMQKTMKGWDTVRGLSSSRLVDWQTAVDYQSVNTTREWRAALHKFGVEKSNDPSNVRGMAPLGKMIPAEAPPIMPMERIPVESMWQLSEGRWIVDFGKAMSGSIRFEGGLPPPIVPKDGYPRGHFVNSTVNPGEEYITVIYGEDIDYQTGDMGVHVVAAMGLHDGTKKKKDVIRIAGPCYQNDMGTVALQRDVFVIGKNHQGKSTFEDVHQSMFTTHGFRFAEVCCTKEPPSDMYAIPYRTAVQEWGEFTSSNVVLNGAYELTKNAFDSNMLGVQSDCPHREKLQYGGDILANSPAALHLFDNSAFYGKVIHDFAVAQWDNGAYTNMPSWLNMLRSYGIGKGAGETVWAACPSVLTARHFQHYGDMELVRDTFVGHTRWLEFLAANWKRGMNEKFPDLDNIKCCEGGLSDWLTLSARDTYLGHHTFYMASARAVVYLAAQWKRLGAKEPRIDNAQISARKAESDMIATMHKMYMKDGLFRLRPNTYMTPGPDLGLFAKVVPGDQRCSVLYEFVKQAGSDQRKRWPGEDENRFFQQLNETELKNDLALDFVRPDGRNQDDLGQKYVTMYASRTSMFEGIFSIRFSLKTLSDMGFHDIALSKATASHYPGFQFMLSHNATTMWETWYMSGKVFSKNHPMFGAVAEWLASSVAGVSLDPSTTAGRDILFWPRFSSSPSIIDHAGATQGTKRGDSAIAWKFLDLPTDKKEWENCTARVQVTLLVAPASRATLRLPLSTKGRVSISSVSKLPDLSSLRTQSQADCLAKRKDGLGFNWNWEFDRNAKIWNRVYRKKGIGAPCLHFLLHDSLETVGWEKAEASSDESRDSLFFSLSPGLYRVKIANWKFTPALTKNGYEKFQKDGLRDYCADEASFDWDELDATHLI